MYKVGIIGLGHVGSTIAYTLVKEALVEELVLIDSNEKITCSEEYDLLDAQVFLTGKTKIKTQDYSSLKDADILVFCPGNIQALGEDGDRFKELGITSQIVREVAPKIKKSGFSGMLISITNPCDIIVTYLQQLVGLPARQVIGTGTLLDTARMKQAVARLLKIDSQNIGGYVYGEHGDSQFVAWSTVTIGNRPLLEQKTMLNLKQLDQAVRDGGWKAFSGKGYTSYGIAMATARLIRMILEDSQIIVPISTYDRKEQCYYGQPAIIGKNGVETLFTCPLVEKEKQLLRDSVMIIKKGLKSVI